jgi:hypothetical protein
MVGKNHYKSQLYKKTTKFQGKKKFSEKNKQIMIDQKLVQ